MRQPTSNHESERIVMGRKSASPSRPQRQRGVGLIEVLIAVLVMAIGLLGIAALQATALRNSQSSMERSQAVVHSYSILDAMRANVAEARAGTYDMGMTCQAPILPQTDPPTPATLGFGDKVAWIAALKSDLGAGACGQIVCAAVAGSDTGVKDCAVTVRWDDSRGTDGADQQVVTTVVRI